MKFWLIRWFDGSTSMWPVSFMSFTQVSNLRRARDVELV
jgi:hypothetical protein